MDRSVPFASALIVLATGVWSGVLGGCTEASVRQQGARGVTATYQRATLISVLPEQVRVPSAIAAAESTFAARGYTVTDKRATEEAGHIRGIPPRTRDFPKVSIDAARVAAGTRVEIYASPFGDEELSRSLLDGILQRLGL